MDRFAIALWDRYFKEPVDSIPKWGKELYVLMKEHLQTCKWFAVYDFLEFTVQNYSFSQPLDEVFVTELNEILKQEASGYRLLERTVAPITDELMNGVRPLLLHAKSSLCHCTVDQGQDVSVGMPIALQGLFQQARG